MLPPFDYFQYLRIRKRKQADRAQRVARFETEHGSVLTEKDKSIINRPIEELVNDVHNGVISPVDVLRTYGRVAVRAQRKTNCITEFLWPEAEQWATKEINIKGPLAGIPVSLKDSINVRGFDTSVGYARKSEKPLEEDGVLTKILKDAGAIPYVKTALPMTLLSFESANGLWGTCDSPHVSGYSPGGSSGGEGAILALGGRIGVGSDVAGSVRVPAAWSGVYSLRCSTGRWPKTGIDTSMPGQEGVPSVFSPMARTLNDLTYFTRSIIQMQPWKYDYTVHPIAWRADEEKEAAEKKLRVGVLRSDGVVPPTPAIARALDTTVDALIAAGHTVVEVIPPASADPFTGLLLASQLLNSDGCVTFNSHRLSGEPNDPGAAQLTRIAYLPRPLRFLYYLYVRYIKRDEKWATLIRHFGPKSSAELWRLVLQREAFRKTWHTWWDSEPQQFDFILCPGNATPALPHRAMHNAVSSCGYTFLWNLLDYSAGIIPVGHVDPKRDALAVGGKNGYKSVLRELGCYNSIARGAWMYYDAEKMAGLPTAVQVVGRRWQEEKVLGYMRAVEDALERAGEKYSLLEVD
ncbi:hypothetical protein VTN49DRAFT_1943 [Thermomyces lanuginosus]|uniref:uncharacterized protein n=1 Tax=Thermomyces lanuginosus TaxID=5541 RepID=UPI00374309EA